jgi:Mce-associated membrane protein
MRRWLVTALTAVVVTGIIALAAVGGALYWDRTAARAEQVTRAAIMALAAEQVPRVFGYDFQTIERSMTEAADLLTPTYRKEFEDRVNKDIIPQARSREIVSQANIVGVGILEAKRDSGSVMVYMNRTITDKTRKPAYDGSRLKVDYQLVGGHWLIGYITPI